MQRYEMTRSNTLSIEYLKQYEDFSEAMAAPDYLIMGRNEETAAYRNYKARPEYKGRILHPERRGDEWTYERNIAFMAGAIVAGQSFLIVSALHNIADRAHRGLSGKCFHKDKLGYATAELLWLEDNGYVFIPHESLDPDLTWAIPPKEAVKNPTMRNNYGHTDEGNPEEQVHRIQRIETLTSYQRQTKKMNDSRSTTDHETTDDEITYLSSEYEAINSRVARPSWMQPDEIGSPRLSQVRGTFYDENFDSPTLSKRESSNVETPAMVVTPINEDEIRFVPSWYKG